MWPDVEDLVCDWFEDLGVVRTWYPPAGEVEALLPLIIVQRTGGGSPDGLQDVALVTVAVTASSRAESWQLMCRIRERIRDADGGEFLLGLVDETAEQVGPQTVPQLNPDQREVQMTFQIVVRPHR